jgi:hypothetical protein
MIPSSGRARWSSLIKPRRDAVSANSNTFNTVELTDADLERVNGGGAEIVSAINPAVLKAEQQLEAAFQKNSLIHLPPLPPLHTAVPH